MCAKRSMGGDKPRQSSVEQMERIGGRFKGKGGRCRMSCAWWVARVKGGDLGKVVSQRICELLGRVAKLVNDRSRVGGDPILSRQKTGSYMEKPRETPVSTRGKHRVERGAPGITASPLSTESAERGGRSREPINGTATNYSNRL